MSLSAASGVMMLIIGQAVPLTHFVVIEIVRGRDFDATAAEFRIDISVADDGYVALRERQTHAPADQMTVAFVVRMHRDGGIAQHGLRSGGCDHEVAFAVEQRIAQMPQAARFLLGDHFQIRQSGLEHRIPVHQPLAAIDQAFAVKPYERLGHRPRELRIHGELVSLPIDRSAQPAQLACDQPARGVLPLPDSFDERVAPKIGAALSGGVQLPFDHHLRGNAGMIHAGLPQRVETHHAPMTNERIHDGVLECMSHVQSAGDVRRRYDDRIGGSGAARREMSGCFPVRINARFDVGGREGFVHGGGL